MTPRIRGCGFRVAVPALRPVLLLVLVCAAGGPIRAQNAQPAGPRLAAEAAVSVDVGTGEIIYCLDMDRRLYPASITKVLTAMLLEENREPADRLSYSALAKAAHPYALDLPVNDTLSAAACMDALLLYSANDVAVMIAENVSGSVAEFAAAMNERSRSVGMAQSRFSNPNGLHQEDHYTTAYDLSRLGRALRRYPWVLETMGKSGARIESGSGRVFAFENRNKLTGVNGCAAGKTGYTDQAGRCLLALYRREGRQILGVLLRSVYDRDDTVVFRDMEELMRWSYAAERELVHAAGEPAVRRTVDVRLLPLVGPTRTLQVPLTTSRDVLVYRNEEEKRIRVDLPEIDPWKLDPEKPVGRLIVEGRDSRTAYELYPTVSWKSILGRCKGFYIPSAAGLLLLAAGIGSLALWRRSASRRSEVPHRRRPT